MLLQWIGAGPSYLGVPGADHWRVTVALRTESEAHQDLSRLHCQVESFILGNNVLLAVSTLMILLGPFTPIYEAATGGLKISVGPPYFNSVYSLWGYCWCC